MISWYRRKYVLLMIIWLVMGNQKPLLAEQASNSSQTPNAESLTNVIPQNQILSSPRQDLCQEANSEYEEIYSFETEEYYINICQSNANFYYYRQSKTDSNDTLLITAKSVFGGSVFRADDNNTIYFVGKDGDSHYSSVMHNNSEIVFEPELEKPVLSVGSSVKKPVEPSISVSNFQLESEVGVDLGLNNSEALTKDSLICTNNNSAYHPALKGWHKLIGKSSDIANKYAVQNGHNFRYLSGESGEATIKTQEGTLINLNIATSDDLVKRVCIQPAAKNI